MWDFISVVWYISIVHSFSFVNIPLSKSFEVHSFLHVFPRQNTSKNYFLETVCKATFILFFFFPNLEKRFIVRKTMPPTYFPGNFLLLLTPLPFAELPPGLCAVRALRRRCGSPRHSCVLLPRPGRRREGTRTPVSWKESVWRGLYHRSPFCGTEPFRSWERSAFLVRRIGVDLF